MEDVTGKEAGFGCLAVFVVVALLIGIFGGTQNIDSGQAGVRTTFGKVDGVVGPGLNFKMPFVQGIQVFSTRTTVYDVDDNSHISDGNGYNDASEDGKSIDGQQIKIAYGISYHINQGDLQYIYSNIGQDPQTVWEKTVKFPSISIVRTVVQQFSAEQLYAGQQVTIENVATPLLTKALAANDVVLDSFVMRRVDFSQAFDDAVAAKLSAQQAALTAQSTAQISQTLAVGLANAEVTQAAADAKAITLVGQALKQNPLVLQDDFIKALPSSKWMIIPSSGINGLLQFPTPQ